jgi:two-component system, sensor histidine kinase and response regulator
MKRASILITIPLFLCVSGRAQEFIPDDWRRTTAEAYDSYLNNPDTAIAITQKVLASAIASGNLYYEGYCYFLFSKSYWVKANYKLSTEYGFKALKIFNDSQHYRELGETLLGLARTLVELGNTHKAREFIDRAFQLGNERSDTWMQAAAFREKSYLFAELDQLDSALQYADKGIAFFETIGDSLDMSILYGRKSRIYFQQKRFKKSHHYAQKALLIDSLVGNRRALGISYYQVAQNEYALGNPAKAIARLKRSIVINNELGNLSWQIKAHELLATFYLGNNEPLLAAQQLQKANLFKDELYNSEKNGQIQEMQSLHELEGKENTILMLEKENTLKQQQVKNQRLFVAFLLVAVLCLVLLIFVLTRLRKIQDKTNRNLADQNLAIKQQRIAIQQQAENLQELDQVKTKLFSVISHDLRGPISNLQSLLDLFTKKLMTADEFIGLSGKLKENLNLTQRTLENLLNWSLSQMEGIRTDKRKIDIANCIDEACSLLEEVASRKNITLHKELTGSMKVWADEDQLQVVLRNLIHNAIKFSSFNDQIQIQASRDNDYCHIRIKDAGIGMTQPEIDTIVGSKQYFSKTGTEQEKGTGLGLLLCKEFITRNGGVIQIRSAIGQGTEVSFTLLLAEHAPELAIQG